MSRRPNPGADRAAQNAQTLKALVKLEGNKVCADCKRNKHPRWASWNLGVFVCIRCSGIHRGMGTHISRVKSVDLDAWTDEQLQNILKWGNTKANKYWESKLAPGHMPSESKIENFIRTKYETKRWVMDGPMPDPATLDADDDVPLNIVQEKAKMERSASLRTSPSAQRPLQQPPRPAPAQSMDLIGDFDIEPPARPSTTDVASRSITTDATHMGAPVTSVPVTPASQPAAQPKQHSLAGLDFFGPSQGAGIGRPSSATSNPTSATNARGDLKNSILSLYASAPKSQPAPQAQQVPHGRQPSFGGMAPVPAQRQDAFGGLADAFGGLSFPTTNSVKSPSVQSPSSSLSGLNFTSTVPAKATPVAPQVTSPPPLSGGSFFDSTAPKPSSTRPSVPASNPSKGLDFGFAQKTTTTQPTPKPAAPVMPTNLFDDDGFDSFASAPPAPSFAAPVQSKSPPAPAVSDINSAFNLSAPAAPKPQPPQSARPAITAQSSSSMFDPWGASDANAWGAPESAPAKPAAPKVELGNVPSRLTPNDISGGWGAPISSANKTSAQPTVTADEDFGGWTSAPAQTPGASTSKPGAGFGASDPFDNPWG